jgi:iron complex transport system substrate-binding protein
MNTRALGLVACLVVAGVVGATGFGASAPTDGADGAGTDGVVAEPAVGAVQQTDCTYPVTVTDTTGTEVTIEERPERVVALQPSDAQILWDIGAQDRVVGMAKTQYTAYLPGRGDKTNVKGDSGVSVEQVIGLQPDVVLAANVTNVETVRQLRSAGVTVYHFGRVTTLSEISRNIRTVGQLVGSCESADETATEFEVAVERARTATERADERPDVLYYFFDFTTGTGTHIHDVIETAGGNNVAADAGIDGYKQVNTEIVVERDPEWIVYPDDATLPNSDAFNGTTAYQQDQTVALRYDYINQPGPRVAVPLTKLAKTWHPEALAAANESVNESSLQDNELGRRTNVTTTPNTTVTNGPGFGPLAAVAGLALAALALGGRRRD